MAARALSRKTRAVRRSDYSLAKALSVEKDKLVTENWRQKKKEGTNKHKQPDSSIHDTSIHCSRSNFLVNTGRLQRIFSGTGNKDKTQQHLQQTFIQLVKTTTVFAHFLI